MQVGQFPASAANSLIEGYCDDFVSLAAVLAQTLEQVAMRGIGFDASRASLQRIENGMRELAGAIHELLDRGSVSTRFESVRGTEKQLAAAAPSQPVPAQSPGQPVPGPTVTTEPRVTGPSLLGRGPMPPRQASTYSPSPANTNQRIDSKEPARPSSPMQPPGATQAPRATQPTIQPTNQTRSSARPAAPAPQDTAPVRPQPGNESSTTPPEARRAGKLEALRGTNQTMPLQSVFQFLGRMRKSGTLHVFIADEILAFEFVNGCIEFTATNRCPMRERLGELLVELGFCTRDGLAPILAKVGVSSANRLGQLVVDAKLVSNGQVLEALEAQVLLRFQRACECNEASYEFESGRRLPGDGRIRIAPFELTIDQPWKLRTP